MNGEALARYILTGLLIVAVVALLIAGTGIPEWFIAIVAGATGNTFRLQVTKPKP